MTIRILGQNGSGKIRYIESTTARRVGGRCGQFCRLLIVTPGTPEPWIEVLWKCVGR